MISQPEFTKIVSQSQHEIILLQLSFVPSGDFYGMQTALFLLAKNIYTVGKIKAKKKSSSKSAHQDLSLE
jgi:hypothetical protein